RCPYFRSELFHCRRKGGSECFAIVGENQDHAVFDNDLCAIVHPSGTATALVALGASLRLRGPRGERVVPIEQFFVKPEQDVTRENVLRSGELIVEVRVPVGRRSEYVKLMQKQTFDWPLADAAVAWDGAAGAIRNARVVLGAAAPIPWRATAAEKSLEGKSLDEAAALAAARLAVQGATPLDKNKHKVPALQAAVLRSLRAAGGLS
ncbi:MAG TPA: FAD binding domain-containing protein, partial [Myxococcales bacterium]|nr:FAD binding domain-containing protein [Myxococcales bacterium]